MKIVLSAFLFSLIALSSAKLFKSVEVNENHVFGPKGVFSLIPKAPKAQLPEVTVVDSNGLDRDQVETIRKVLVQTIDRNLSNQDLTNNIWDYCQREDPESDHLITISKCFDYCYAGALPKYYVTFEIDRGTNRFMIVARNKC